jgi:hypothetical protein
MRVSIHDGQFQPPKTCGFTTRRRWSVGTRHIRIGNETKEEGGTAYHLCWGLLPSALRTNGRPLIIALVVSVPNRRDGRVATFRPIPQSVSGVGVRFSIGDKIRNLGEKSFCLTRRQRKFFILLRCCNHFSFFILTELGVGPIVGNVVAFLWRHFRISVQAHPAVHQQRRGYRIPLHRCHRAPRFFHASRPVFLFI